MTTPFPAKRTLQYAAFMGDLDLVKELLDNGASVDDCDNHPPRSLRGCYRSGESASEVAIRNSEFGVLNMLLEHKADVNRRIQTYESFTLLHQACNSSNIDFDIVDLLLEHRANVNARNYWGETPLLRLLTSWGSADGSNRKQMWLLLDAKADVTDPDLTGLSPIIFAMMLRSPLLVTEFSKAAKIAACVDF